MRSDLNPVFSPVSILIRGNFTDPGPGQCTQLVRSAGEWEPVWWPGDLSADLRWPQASAYRRYCSSQVFIGMLKSQFKFSSISWTKNLIWILDTVESTIFLCRLLQKATCQTTRLSILSCLHCIWSVFWWKLMILIWIFKFVVLNLRKAFDVHLNQTMLLFLAIMHYQQICHKIKVSIVRI